jgi:hypothetical protein
MAEPTLDEVLDVPTQAEVIDGDVLPELRRNEVRVSDWSRISVYRAMVYVVALLFVQVRQIIAAIAAAGFEDYVFGLVEVPNGIDVTSWATDVARQRYGIERIEATHTRRRFTLTNSVASSYGPLQSGDIVVEFPSIDGVLPGNRYVLDEDDVTIPSAGEVEAIFRSEFPVDSDNNLNYDDVSDESDIILVTAQYPGVTVTNPAPDFTDVTQSGSGIGTVTPSGTPNDTYTFRVEIDATGTIGGGALWTPYVDDVAQAQQSGASAANVGGTGVTITLANNGGSPAFVEGTVFHFSTPGTDVTEVGRNQETPQELGARCRAIWPLLAAPIDLDSDEAVPVSPTAAGYVLLAKRASDEVKVVFVDTDDTINNRVYITVAGQGALLSGSTIANVQAYFDQFEMITDDVVVQSATTRTITLASVTVVVRRGQKEAVAARMKERLRNYFRGVDATETLEINGLIDHAYVSSLIRNTPGVKRFPTDEDFTINGTNDDYQLPGAAGAYELALWTQDPSSDFTWQEE